MLSWIKLQSEQEVIMTKSHAVRAENVLRVASELFIPAATTFRTIKLQPQLDRYENDAEHSFLVATVGCALAHQLDQGLDLGKISQYALAHDLVEVYAGDTTIWAPKEEHDTKVDREEQALKTIEKNFSMHFPWISETIKQYEKFEDPESCFVYALDKIIPYIVMASVDHQPYPPSRALFEEKMAVARDKIQRFPELLPLFDELHLDYTKRPHFFSES